MQDYNTIIGSIQMRLNGCQTRSVMDRYKIGSGTLNLIMSRYHANGIPIEELRMMAPKEVVNLFYPQKNLQRKDVPLPDFQYYYDRIHAPGSHMNISFCWLDYKEKNPDCELPVFFRLNRESLYLCFKIILFFRLFSI